MELSLFLIAGQLSAIGSDRMGDRPTGGCFKFMWRPACSPTRGVKEPGLLAPLKWAPIQHVRPEILTGGINITSVQDSLSMNCQTISDLFFI